MLYPEAIAYLFTLEGCSKNLLFYLLFFSHNTSESTLKCNAYIKRRFKDFASNFFGIKYKSSTIDQAIKELRSKNIMISISTGLNLLNPLLAGDKNEFSRRSKISEFATKLAMESGKADINFYPRYKIT